MSSLFEQQLQSFFQNVGGLHASNIMQEIPNHIPLMQRYPEITAREVHRFRRYLTDAPSHNHAAALKSLTLIAQRVPEVRDRLVKDFGDILFEYKAMARDLPYGQDLHQLLRVLAVPVTEQDRYLKELARSVITLGQPLICIIGAGFSYDRMPITVELNTLLVGLLRRQGVRDPVSFLREDDRAVWELIKRDKHELQSQFSGWCARSSPTFQHQAIAEMLKNNHISHLISFNWDDLCERAYFERFGVPIQKVVQDGNMPATPALWKLHGDVSDPASEWIFPYDEGRVFDTLLESLNIQINKRSPSHALIIGYSEYESIVRDRLISWLEKNIPNVLRVRPNWEAGNPGGLRESAKRFFQRLSIYIELEQREHAAPK